MFQNRRYRLIHRLAVGVHNNFGIFRRLGMHTVFFGRDLVGAGLPSLSYMLAFADTAAREKAWAAFRDDAAWVKLRDQPAYADVVSGIDATILRPTDYSQI